MAYGLVYIMARFPCRSALQTGPCVLSGRGCCCLDPVAGHETAADAHRLRKQCKTPQQKAVSILKSTPE